MKTKYIEYVLSLTEGQKTTLAKAARDGTGATIRLTAGQLRGNDNLGLTNSQANRVAKSLDKGRRVELRFSKTQMKKMTKMGGILPLLALLPLLFGGLTAAGTAAGGAAAIAKAVHSKGASDAALAESKRADDAALAEAKRHNLELETQARV